MAMQTQDHAAAPAAPGHEATATQEGTEHAGGHESGGLPQFDFAQWPGQILWFLIIFFTVLAFMRLFAVPKVGGAIEQRKTYINDQIADARRLFDESRTGLLTAEAEAAQARANAQKLAAEARDKIKAEAAGRLSEEEAKLTAKSDEAERRIAKARDAAMVNVRTIATDTAEAIIEKLTGRPATKAELTGARR